jgi:secreted trypsin-like serine protease
MRRIRIGLLACFVLVFASLSVVRAAGAQTVEPRVVGGQTTTIEDYPWQAAVVVSSAKSPTLDAHERQFCGGSLLTASIVLTAAHCIYDTDPNCASSCNSNHPVCTSVSDPSPGDGTCKLDPDDVDVVLGRTTLSNESGGTEQSVQATAYQGDDGNPPIFNPNSLKNDVGYLVLTTPVTLGPATQTIHIAGGDEQAVWAPSVLAEITGWGSTIFGGDTVDTLRAASVPVVADSTCSATGVYGTFFDPATMVCAGKLSGGVDTCQGDSGGPLEAPLDGGAYRLVGITSWGFGCAQPNAPGVYSRIAGTALRDAAVARVAAFETDLSLTPEEIVGSGGQPRSGPPPSSPDPTPPAQPMTSTPPPKSDPYLKCRKIRNKPKRKRCHRRVRSSLGK